MPETLSPYLPGTHVQYAWDSTSLGYLKTCPRLYYYQMLCGWTTSDESIHLRFGREYHKALEDFDRYRIADGLPPKDALHETILQTHLRTRDWNPNLDTKAGKYKNRSTLLRTTIDYLDHYSPDPAKTIVLDNGQPAVELSFRFELSWGPGEQPKEISYNPSTRELRHGTRHQPYVLCGHLDRVVEFNSDLFVMDRKTTTTTPGSYYFDGWSPHNQMTLYTLASQVVVGAPVKGVIIDAAQILVYSSAFVRGFTFRTGDQIDEWMGDLSYWFSLAETFARQNYWPMNDTACDKFGGCRFRKICSKSPQVREKFLRSEFVQQPEEERWNPLKPR